MLKDLGYKATGIRLDSGDLADLSLKCRQIMKEVDEKFSTDFTSTLQIVVSNDINEEVLNHLNEVQHSIDVFGIGTNLVTC